MKGRSQTEVGARIGTRVVCGRLNAHTGGLCLPGSWGVPLAVLFLPERPFLPLFVIIKTRRADPHVLPDPLEPHEVVFRGIVIGRQYGWVVVDVVYARVRRPHLRTAVRAVSVTIREFVAHGVTEAELLEALRRPAMPDEPQGIIGRSE